MWFTKMRITSYELQVTLKLPVTGYELNFETASYGEKY